MAFKKGRKFYKLTNESVFKLEENDFPALPSTSYAQAVNVNLKAHSYSEIAAVVPPSLPVDVKDGAESKSGAVPKKKKKCKKKENVNAAEPVAVPKKCKKSLNSRKKKHGPPDGKITLLEFERHRAIVGESGGTDDHVINEPIDLKSSLEYPELHSSINSCVKRSEKKEKIKGVLNIAPSSAATEKKLNTPICLNLQEIIKKTSELQIKNSPKIVATFNVKREKINTSSFKTPHNILDSSAPRKRGKEREKPKKAKISALKKIILKERMKKREKILNRVATALAIDQNASENEQFKENLETMSDDVSIAPNKVSIATNEVSIATNEVSIATNEVSIATNEVYIATNDEIEKYLSTSTLENDVSIATIEPNMEMVSIVMEKYVSMTTNSSTSIPKNKIKQNFDPIATVSIDVNEIEQNFVPVATVFTETSGIELDLNSVQMKCKKDMAIEDEPVATAIESPFIYKDERPEIDSNTTRCIELLLHSKKFREYCDQLLCVQIDSTMEKFLSNLVRFQDRAYNKDPVKAKIKKRIICGLKEVTKNAKMKKLKLVIIAPDVEKINSEGGLNDALDNIANICRENCVRVVFGMDRRKLGRVLKKQVPLSCVGVFNYEGTEDEHKRLIELVDEARLDYDRLIDTLKAKLKLENELKMELIECGSEKVEGIKRMFWAANCCLRDNVNCDNGYYHFKTYTNWKEKC